MMRKTYEELEKIKKKYKVSDIYSWSKYNTYKTDKYSYFLKYILKIKEDKNDSLYAPSGSCVHQILQDYYEHKIKYEEMLERYESGLLEFNLLGLKYDRSDEEKNKKIADKYECCIRHFLQNHVPIKQKVDNERFVLIHVKPFLFQGFIDAIYLEDGIYKIIDFKTSTIYTGSKILKEGGQLILYTEALRQLGVPLNKIKAYWNFLKYVTVESPQANGKISTRHIERNEIGNKLASSVKMWLKKNKYSQEDIDSYVSTMCLTNSLDCLPKEVGELYTIGDCYVEVPITEEIIDNLKNEIVETLIEINKKELEYSKTKDDNIFWQDVDDSNSFFHTVLGGYSTKHHRPLREYLESREMFKQEQNEEEDENLDWLNELD
jgi:hypothetical protein